MEVVIGSCRAWTIKHESSLDHNEKKNHHKKYRVGGYTMHVLIISPLREGYMNLCGWLDGLKSERVTILTQTKYENNMN